MGAGCLETCWSYHIPMLESICHPEPVLQCANVKDKAWESQELAQSHVDKPELKPAAKPIQDPGPFRLAQRSISALQLNLTRTGTKVMESGTQKGAWQIINLMFPDGEQRVRAAASSSPLRGGLWKLDLSLDLQGRGMSA